MNKSELIEWLRTNEVEVTFIKTDGTERVMRCSLKPDVLVEHVSVSSHHKKMSDEVVNVIDLDKKEWRSFRVDSVKSFKVL